MERRFIKKIIKLKKAQDEMVGFGLIIVLVSVILLVFVASTLNKTKNLTKAIDDYEANAFVQSTLQYTTACKIDSKNIDVTNLIFKCTNKVKCSNNLDSCYVLENTIKEILKESWKAGGLNVTKGYELVILTNSEVLIKISEGDINSKNFRANPPTEIEKSGDHVEFYFTVYY
jgi:hypothetical protein